MKKIGAHVSASGGLDKAIVRADDIGANCLQLFSGSPRMWRKKDLTKVETTKLFAKQKELNITPIFTHALYLVNLVSDKKELLEKSVNSIIYELKFDSKIKGSGVIIHAGSHQGRGWDASKELLIEQIKTILDQTPADSTLLIENSAGQKGKLHSNLNEIRWTLDQLSKYVQDNRLGWCFDTCHAHAAGYHLGKEKDNAVEKITQLDLWPTLKIIHVNDSRDNFDSGRDRHDNIGDGKIPKEDLKYFLNFQKVTDIPLVTEVPGLDGKGPDKENVERIRKLIN